MAMEASSPTGVEGALDYLTVESYHWPKPQPPKRARLEDEERKRRHREGQRQFMIRKRARVLVLRQQVAALEMQHRLLTAWIEEKALRATRSDYMRQLTQLDEEQVDERISSTVDDTTTTQLGDDDKLLIEVILSW